MRRHSSKKDFPATLAGVVNNMQTKEQVTAKALTMLEEARKFGNETMGLCSDEAAMRAYAAYKLTKAQPMRILPLDQGNENHD